ncbi:MAG TPA: STAS domain-containing protein [bacterium]|nr:STAS domain-containing protein [bacterium]
MGQLNLVLRTAAGNSEVSVLEAAGVLDVNTVGDFEDVLNSLFRNKRFRIILDLGKLDYISSAGIGVLIGNIKEIRKNKGDIRISGVTADVYKVFDLLELPKLFHFHRDEREATLAF